MGRLLVVVMRLRRCVMSEWVRVVMCVVCESADIGVGERLFCKQKTAYEI